MASARRQMQAAVEATRERLAALRTGRPSPELLGGVRVEAWGGQQPLAHVAQIGVQPPRTLVVMPHDPSLYDAVERALRASDVGAQPSGDGARLRVELPPPSGERRVELARTARQHAETGRVAVRTVRRDTINAMRRKAKAGELAQAQVNRRTRDLQELTDEHVARIDELLATTLAELKQG